MQATARFTAFHYSFIACYAVSAVIERSYKRAREFSLNISHLGFNKSTGPRNVCVRACIERGRRTRDCRTLYSEQPYRLFCARKAGLIKKDEMAGCV